MYYTALMYTLSNISDSGSVHVHGSKKTGVNIGHKTKFMTRQNLTSDITPPQNSL